MDIKFSFTASDDRCISKILEDETVISGTLRDEVSIIEPIIVIKYEVPVRFNYCYIPEFRRYYFITNVENVRTGIWRVYLKVDPLMSFKGDILALKVVANKQSMKSNGDEYIDDGSLVTDNLIFKDIYHFANGFNDNGKYILITAG